MLDLHNRKRASRGLPRLCIHPKLQKAARAHPADMIRRDYFSHYTKGRNEGDIPRAATKVHASASVATATTGAFAERISPGARAEKVPLIAGSRPG